ncbi:hypothetical protein [Campylobacter corcagiensis]|uniref:Uncharacterized protein n=1 Tax=Campylobacter corcagiensis TaxID=1448857 RepID=A0A7M1LDN7_9BACT|nr:hypothetical protein [Campylobacter corcagiensis]QKF65180.1 hypothetical protein CCORG_1337 [Campylobacter corcagiensis]QOQ86677.1 hypothetical protein IMC76_05470 [Campylobacter corcagiensis]
MKFIIVVQEHKNKPKKYEITSLNDIVDLCKQYNIKMSEKPFNLEENKKSFYELANPKNEFFAEHKGRKRWLGSNKFDKNLIVGICNTIKGLCLDEYGVPKYEINFKEIVQKDI